MGSLGAKRLNAVSDLDLIVIYDGGNQEASEGRRPLATRAYYARLTQALVTALSAPTAEGRLYEVDMRLRPSGRQGPVATSLTSYRTYQTGEAWTWERLALTRARPVAGSEDVGADVSTVRAEVLGQPQDRAKVLSDVADMRARLAEAKRAETALEAKVGPGRLTDIELFAETAALLSGGVSGTTLDAQLPLVADTFEVSTETMASLEKAADLFWQVQAASRLFAGSEAVRPEEIGKGAETFLLRETGADGIDDLIGRMETAADEMAALIDGAIGCAPERR